MYNVGLAWFAGPGREGIDHIGRIPSFLLLRNFEGAERMRHYGLDEQINHLRESGYRTLRVAGRVTFWLSGAGKSVF